MLSGSIEREMQELLAPGDREQVAGEEVTGVLRVPERGQGGETPARTGDRAEPEVPRFHLVGSVEFHPESLQSRCLHPRLLLPLANLLRQTI